jgi:hypothetical protein
MTKQVYSTVVTAKVSVQISCVVEGHGDAEAVPILIKRIAGSIQPPLEVKISATIRTPKSKLVKAGEIERAVELAARKLTGRGAVFVLIDSDDDCPGQLGPALLARARASRADLPVGVVIAKSEFECWFIASIESIAGQNGFLARIQTPRDPESIRGAKEWLTQQMQEGRSYAPTLDQPVLARLFDLEMALRADSFSKCHREVSRILLELSETENR